MAEMQYVNRGMMRSASELLRELNSVDESPGIEAKRASEAGKSLLETLVAFANEPGLGGGYLLLGVERIASAGKTQYQPVGIPDPDKLQADLATQCAGMLNIRDACTSGASCRGLLIEMWTKLSRPGTGSAV